MSEPRSRVLANTGYRALADVGGKVGSIVLFIVMGRKLGDSAFGVFTFGYALVALLTSLSDFGQDKVLTREVSRRPEELDRYFFNTLVLKVALAVPVLIVATGVLAALGATGRRSPSSRCSARRCSSICSPRRSTPPSRPSSGSSSCPSP